MTLFSFFPSFAGCVASCCAGSPSPTWTSAKSVSTWFTASCLGSLGSRRSGWFAVTCFRSLRSGGRVVPGQNLPCPQGTWFLAYSSRWLQLMAVVYESEDSPSFISAHLVLCPSLRLGIEAFSINLISAVVCADCRYCRGLVCLGW